jgi:hypothetical protein
MPSLIVNFLKVAVHGAVTPGKAIGTEVVKAVHAVRWRP